MLLSLTKLKQKYNLNITGVIHIGAHYGEEVEEYHKNDIKNIVLIEPCAKAFNVLKNKFGAHRHIKLFNVACASIVGEAMMYTETRNKGQSNSLLKPVEHLTHYPDIIFDGNERVQLMPLDNLNLGNTYNFINMDVQGAEGNVLVGSKKTIEHIDYIYTEVNAPNANLYHGATDIDHLDALLNDFIRVDTCWTQQGWGDALYIRKTKLNSL